MAINKNVEVSRSVLEVEALILRTAYNALPDHMRFKFLKSMFSQARKSERPAYYRAVIRKALSK